MHAADGLLVGLLICTFFFASFIQSSPVHPPPEISETFTCNTIETDDEKNIIVKQRLAFDVDIRRTAMTAYGPLVHGGLQQFRRCDLHPTGWMSSAGGKSAENASTWECTNTTISRVGELPTHCQMGTFWNFPPMVYQGETSINGIECGEWSYKMNGDKYSVWITDKAVPVASGRVESSSSGLYMLYFTDFAAETPTDDEFEPVDGCNCPASTPPVTPPATPPASAPVVPAYGVPSVPIPFTFMKLVDWYNTIHYNQTVGK